MSRGSVSRDVGWWETELDLVQGQILLSLAGLSPEFGRHSQGKGQSSKETGCDFRSLASYAQMVELMSSRPSESTGWAQIFEGREQNSKLWQETGMH